MAKKNFSKVEDLLEAGLEKMKAAQLGKIADIAQKSERPEMRKFIERASVIAAKTNLERKGLIHGIEHAMDEFKDPTLNFYAAIGIQEEDLKALLDKYSKEQTPEKKSELQQIRDKILAFKKEFLQKHPDKDDVNIVAKERKKHINKRFNVNDKWLPLK